MTPTSLSSSSSSPSPLDWKFSQVFGERLPGEDLQDADVISAIEFERSGNYLAVGDKGGRVVIFDRHDGKDRMNHEVYRSELERMDFPFVGSPEYHYKTEFQSHEPEFDYLKSLEIEEKINKIRWCPTQNGSLFILSTNDKTIKLWKIKERKVKKRKELDPNPAVYSESSLFAERSYMSVDDQPVIANGHHMESTDRPFEEADSKIAYVGDSARASCRKVFAHAHDFNINSISNNSDGETFVSADDLRINLWNLEISDQCFNIIDMKPSNMEDLTEVITSAEFHPIHCNLLAYSSSRGFIRLVDLRQSAICDHNAKILQDADCHGSKSFFTEIIASISDMKFTNDGQHILSRDYLTLKDSCLSRNLWLAWLCFLFSSVPALLVSVCSFEILCCGTYAWIHPQLRYLIFTSTYAQSYAICITMIPSLINLSAVSAEMDLILLLDLTAIFCVYSHMELEMKKESQ